MSIFSICEHTVQESFDSRHRKPLKNVTEIYRTAIMPRIRQTERSKAFGMLVAATRV